MSKDKFILVIDDEEEIRKLLELGISKLSGVSTKSVNTGAKALKVLEERKPDAIILDIVMPEMDGFSFLKKIKSMPDLKDVPVIISSGKGGLKDYFELVDDDVKPDEFLAKPYKINDLLDTVKKVL
ncbi:MAG: response regulator [Elusimicrobiota bacterium]